MFLPSSFLIQYLKKSCLKFYEDEAFVSIFTEDYKLSQITQRSVGNICSKFMVWQTFLPLNLSFFQTHLITSQKKMSKNSIVHSFSDIWAIVFYELFWLILLLRYLSFGNPDIKLWGWTLRPFGSCRPGLRVMLLNDNFTWANCLT